MPFQNFSYDRLGPHLWPPAVLCMLEEMARRVRKGASWSPYSNFQVGCAVEIARGKYVYAFNQENRSFPNGICAETLALSYAASRYPDHAPQSVVLRSFYRGEPHVAPVTPCGRCRQVMLEIQNRFESPFKVWMVGRDEAIVVMVSDLLPFAFESDLDASSK